MEMDPILVNTIIIKYYFLTKYMIYIHKKIITTLDMFFLNIKIN